MKISLHIIIHISFSFIVFVCVIVVVDVVCGFVFVVVVCIFSDRIYEKEFTRAFTQIRCQLSLTD